jgi:drug/metabolite transporter (DMT)-like permease
MKTKLTLQQILTITSAILFLIGAIFMLVQTFADQSWAFWVGLGFAVAATACYIYLIFENRKLINKKLDATKPEATPTITENPSLPTE